MSFHFIRLSFKSGRFIKEIQILDQLHPVLSKPSLEITNFSEEKVLSAIHKIHIIMKGNLNKNERIVGVSAPQLGYPFRLFSFRETEAERTKTWIIGNPILTVMSTDTITSEEGCLSSLFVKCKVERYSRIRLRGWDCVGEIPYDRVLSGDSSCIVQHEIDHLNGIIWPPKTELELKKSFKDS